MGRPSSCTALGSGPSTPWECIVIAALSRLGVGADAVEVKSAYRRLKTYSREKCCRTKVPFFFFSNFALNFSPSFSRSFRASFRGKRRLENVHQKSVAFFNAKFSGKFEEIIHKSFLESGRSNKAPLC